MVKPKKSKLKSSYLPKFYFLFAAGILVLVGLAYVYFNHTAYATPTSTSGLQLADTAWENSDDRTLLKCTPLSGSCTDNADLFNDLSFNCPTQGGSSCSATITVSLAHNCTENVPYINLKIDGTVVPVAGDSIKELRICNPSEANGDFDTLISYTFTQPNLTPGTHTANIYATYDATTATGLGIDHKTLKVDSYIPNVVSRRP